MKDIKHIKRAFRQRAVPAGGAQGTKRGKRGYDRGRAKADLRTLRSEA